MLSSVTLDGLRCSTTGGCGTVAEMRLLIDDCVGTVQVERTSADAAEIGLFSVDPDVQGGGIGGAGGVPVPQARGGAATRGRTHAAPQHAPPPASLPLRDEPSAPGQAR